MNGFTDNLNFLMGALGFAWDVAWKPAVVVFGFSGLIILLVGTWIVWDALHWRKQTRAVRRRLAEKDLTVYGLKRRAER